MKKIMLISVLMVLCPLTVFANPFIVCDPQTGVQFYKVTGAAWVPATVTAEMDGSIKMDISTSPVGTSNLNFSACINDSVWGELCSVTSPFSFTRPGTPSKPTGAKLAP